MSVAVAVSAPIGEDTNAVEKHTTSIEEISSKDIVSSLPKKSQFLSSKSASKANLPRLDTSKNRKAVSESEVGQSPISSAVRSSFFKQNDESSEANSRPSSANNAKTSSLSRNQSRASSILGNFNHRKRASDRPEKEVLVGTPIKEGHGLFKA